MHNPQRRLFVVDDDEGIRESLRFLFEESDFVLEEAANGIEALNHLQAAPAPRVLLLDRMMPRMDGFDVLRAMLQLPDVQQRTAVVFSSARNDLANAELAYLLDTGTVARVNKPFHLDDLFNAVERAWAHLVASLQAEDVHGSDN